MTMKRYLQSVLVAALGVGSVTGALAQDAPLPPPTTTTQPSAGTEPSTTMPHDRQAAATSKEAQKQAMKDCVANEQANNTGVSESQAKKTCKEQMKSNSSSPKNY
jgi:hypothetical protein